MGTVYSEEAEFISKIHNDISCINIHPLENIKSRLQYVFFFLCPGDPLEGYSFQNKVGIISVSHTGHRILIYFSWPARP
jgi:hypothetical protein